MYGQRHSNSCHWLMELRLSEKTDLQRKFSIGIGTRKGGNNLATDVLLPSAHGPLCRIGEVGYGKGVDLKIFGGIHKPSRD